MPPLPNGGAETGSALESGTDDSGIAASPNAGPPSTEASELAAATATRESAEMETNASVSDE